MGRYYQTDKPEFVQDVIMRPDYNLYERSLATVQKDYDTQKAIAEQLMDLQFNHLNSEEENANAATAKDYYLQNANEIASLMMADKTNYRKYMGRLKDLQRELKKDFSEGPIALMQASYNQEKAWREANKKHLETNPALYNALYREAQKNWGGNSVTKGIWNQENALKQFDQQKVEENIQKLVADIKKSSIQTTNGKYKTTIDNEVKELTEQDILNYAVNKVLSDPEALAYFRQAQRVGIGNYFNQDGSLNTTGGQLGSWLQGLRSYAYKQEDYAKKINEDQYGRIAAREAADEAKQKRLMDYKKQLEKVDEITATRNISESLYGSKEEVSKDVQALLNKKYQREALIASGKSKDSKEVKEKDFTPDEQEMYNLYLNNLGNRVIDNIDTKQAGSYLINSQGLQKIGIDTNKLRSIKYKRDKGEVLSIAEKNYLTESATKIAKHQLGDNGKNGNINNIYNKSVVEEFTQSPAGGTMPVAMMQKSVVNGTYLANRFNKEAQHQMYKDYNSDKYNITKTLTHLDLTKPELKQVRDVLNQTLQNSITNIDNIVTYQNGKPVINDKVKAEIKNTGFWKWLRTDENLNNFAQALQAMKREYGDSEKIDIGNPDMFKIESVLGTNGKEMYITINPKYLEDMTPNGNVFKVTDNEFNANIDDYQMSKAMNAVKVAKGKEKDFIISNTPVTTNIKADVTKSIVSGFDMGRNVTRKEIPDLRNKGVTISTKNYDDHIEVIIEGKDRNGKMDRINFNGEGGVFGIPVYNGLPDSKTMNDLGLLLSNNLIFENYKK